jgi:predicted tellurium resistance membrane protein TerC
MTHNYSSQQQHRHAFLGVFLTLLALGLALLVLIFLSGGLFLYVVLFGGAIVMLGMFHYVLWGRAFTDEVAGEREEEQLRQRAAEMADEEEWQRPDTRIRR